jgi:DNA-binding NtrC family response regulator/tetratricopeptide (TPR) repeat protein
VHRKNVTAASRRAATVPESGSDWEALGERARIYLAAGAWESAHDLLWPRLAPHWELPRLPAEALECLCLLLATCSRLDHSDHLARGCDWLRQAVDAGTLSQPESVALAALSLAHQEAKDGRYGPARGRLDAIPADTLAQSSAGTRARIALLRGRIAAVDGDEREAERQGLEAARCAETAGNEILKGDAFSLLAILARRSGSLGEANALYSKAASHYWRAGDLNGHAVVLLNRAWALGLIGLLPDSKGLFEESLHHATCLGRAGTALRARLGVGWVAVRGGELESARAGLLSVWRAARRAGMAREETMALEYLAEAYILSDAPSKARRAISLGSRLAYRLAPRGDLALELRVKEALLAVAEGETIAAVPLARAAIAHARELGMRWEEAQAERILAMAYLRRGRRRDARKAFQRAAALLEKVGERLERHVVDAWLVTLAPGSAGSRGARQGHKRLNASRTRPDAGLPESLRFWLAHPLLGPERWPPSDSRRQRPRRPDSRPEPAGNSPMAAASPSHQPPTAPAPRHPFWHGVGLVTRSPEVLTALHLVETYAPGMIPALIQGETGTGKDLVAQGLHALSGHPGHLVPVNCAAARKDLFVAELFGARRGAYTGAVENRRGLIQEAANGTLFLDEIADLEPEAQGFLLRFLDSGEVRPVGGTESHQVITRVVAATCQDLVSRVAEGGFRADLYARLAGLVVVIPPLRERLADLDLIIEVLWQREGGRLEDWRKIFNDAVLVALGRWHWPGNVRELHHMVSRALLFGRSHGPDAARANLLEWIETVCTQRTPGAATSLASAVGKGAVPPMGTIASASPHPLAGRSTVGHWDPLLLQEALKAAGGRISRAAKILGLSRSHAYRLYKRLADKD